MLEPKPLAAALDALSLRAALRRPGAAARAAGAGRQGAALGRPAGSGSVKGTINDQRFEARLDAAAGPRRVPFVDVDASFGTLDLNRFVAPASRGAAPAPAAAATPVNLQALQWADARLRAEGGAAAAPALPHRRARRCKPTSTTACSTCGALPAAPGAGASTPAAAPTPTTASSRCACAPTTSTCVRMLADTTGFDGLRGRGRIDADLRSRGATVGALRAALDGRADAGAAAGRASAASTWRRRCAAGARVPEGSSTTLAGDTQRADRIQPTRRQLRHPQRRGPQHRPRRPSDFLRVGGEGSIDLAQGRARLPAAHPRGEHRHRPRRAGDGHAQRRHRAGGPARARSAASQWQVNWPSVTAGVAVRAVPNVAARHGGRRDARRHRRGARRGRPVARWCSRRGDEAVALTRGRACRDF